MNDYWDNDEPYDEVAAELKAALHDSVRTEIKKRIEKLETENRELKEKLKGLDTLEREAVQAKARFDREYATAKYQAASEFRKEKLVELLAVIDERLYTVERVYLKREKCDLCNDNRQILYKTPRGREQAEMCVCATNDPRWQAVEVVAHEVSRRSGKLMLWWVPVNRYEDADWVGSPKHLKRAESATATEHAEDPTAFSFKDMASAQAVADAANKKVDL